MTGTGGSGRASSSALNGKIPAPRTGLPVDDHPATQVGGSSAFGIDPPAAANVLTEGGHHTQVGRQLVGMKVGRAAANHDQVHAFRQGLVAQRRELDKFGPEGLKRFESVRKITAKCLILRIGDPEAPAAFRKAAGTRSGDGRGERRGSGPASPRASRSQWRRKLAARSASSSSESSSSRFGPSSPLRIVGIASRAPSTGTEKARRISRLSRGRSAGSASRSMSTPSTPSGNRGK